MESIQVANLRHDGSTHTWRRKNSGNVRENRCRGEQRHLCKGDSLIVVLNKHPQLKHFWLFSTVIKSVSFQILLPFPTERRVFIIMITIIVIISGQKIHYENTGGTCPSLHRSWKLILLLCCD